MKNQVRNKVNKDMEKGIDEGRSVMKGPLSRDLDEVRE